MTGDAYPKYSLPSGNWTTDLEHANRLWAKHAGWDSTTVIDTDHGVYDALPARDADDAPEGSVLTVFRDGGSLAGYVAGTGGQYVALLATERGNRIAGVRATLAGAASLVADRDRG